MADPESKVVFPVGKYPSNSFNGHCKIMTDFDNDRCCYEGDVRNGKRHGHGIETFPEGGKYDGDWQNDLFHGQGCVIWPDGREFHGEYRHDKRHGQGKVIWPDGREFSGEYKNGKRHGYGIEILSDGSLRHGEWKDGERFEESTLSKMLLTLFRKTTKTAPINSTEEDKDQHLKTFKLEFN